MIELTQQQYDEMIKYVPSRTRRELFLEPYTPDVNVVYHATLAFEVCLHEEEQTPKFFDRLVQLFFTGAPVNPHKSNAKCMKRALKVAQRVETDIADDQEQFRYDYQKIWS